MTAHPGRDGVVDKIIWFVAGLGPVMFAGAGVLILVMYFFYRVASAVLSSL